MDISPKFEAQLEKASYSSLLSEFEGKILPAHHPITLHVHRVVSDLLGASDLGTLHSTNPRKPPTEEDGFWSEDPREPPSSPTGGVKEWNLLVVNDPKIVNALASFGMACRRTPSPLSDPFPGTIVVFTGILPVCKNEAGLAAVVGHGVYPNFSSMKSVLKLGSEIGHAGTLFFALPDRC